MADDELGIYLSAVDPTRVVSGEEDEMGVIIMALVVIAKRRGLDVSIDRSEGAASIESVPAGRLRRVRERNGEEQETQDEQDTGVFSMMDREDDTGDISVEPLEPDYTVSSPIATPALSPDVFGSLNVGHTRSISDGLFARSDRDFVHQRFALPLKERLGGVNENEHADFYGHNVHQDGYEAYSTPMPRGLSPVSFLPTDLGHRDDSHPSRRTRHATAIDTVSTWREDSQTTLISASGSVHKTADADSRSSGKGAQRTVLQDMMDEFGLG